MWLSRQPMHLPKLSAWLKTCSLQPVQMPAPVWMSYTNLLFSYLQIYFGVFILHITISYCIQKNWWKNAIKKIWKHATQNTRHFLSKSYNLHIPGPLNMAFIVPDVNACSRFTINSWPSEEINLTYIASGPSQPPYVFSSPSRPPQEKKSY